MNYYSEHRLHTGKQLIEAIFEWEQFQIEKGFIRGLGLRAIAFK